MGFLGCPNPSGQPQLTVDPPTVNFGNVSESDSFTIRNSGAGTLTWSLSIDFDGQTEWLSADSVAGTTTTETDRITLTADRSGLAPSPTLPYTATITVSSDGGAEVVNVFLYVPGTPLLDVSPGSVVFGLTTESVEVTLSSLGDDTVTWSAEITDPSDPTAETPFTVTPGSGALLPGGEVTLTIAFDREAFDEETTEYVLTISSNAGFALVTISVGGTTTNAEIAVEPDTLNFGVDKTQLTFDVYNSGPIGSLLQFEITTDREDLILIEPTSGESEGRTSELDGVSTIVGELDRRTISVYIDRRNIQAETDGGTITVSATGLASKEITVIVERAPLTIEGTFNRHRPPYIQRFVFLLRDMFGEAIDTTSSAELAKIRFFIEEDEIPLDVDETSRFVQGPENLRCNLILLLDYTGSMYYAGVDRAVDPLDPGDAIQQMEEATKAFIDHLPDGYRIALMEHHDRLQQDRLIHGFSTNKESLKAALDAFSVPEGEHGASELYEALIEACSRLADEDAPLPPLDDTDVQAVLFISDGRDTSSVKTIEDVIKEAADKDKDRRVRFYPVGFGESINSTVLTQLAVETGGHRYDAPTVTKLTELLGTTITQGKIWTELERQIVLTYLTLWTDEDHTYQIRVEYQVDANTALNAYFTRGSIFNPGDVRAGQITLWTTGVSSIGTAEVFVRAEYIPRNISYLRFRFIVPAGVTMDINSIDLLEDDAGLLAGWRILEDDTAPGAFILLTNENDYVPYGAFGNLLKLTFEGLDPDDPENPLDAYDEFNMGFRVDNTIYINPPFSKYFQYPGDFLNHTPGDGDFVLTIGPNPDSAVIEYFAAPDVEINVDDPETWNWDGDDKSDFDDLYPYDPDRS